MSEHTYRPVLERIAAALERANELKEIELKVAGRPVCRRCKSNKVGLLPILRIGDREPF